MTDFGPPPPLQPPTDRPTHGPASTSPLPAQIPDIHHRHFAIAGGRAGRLRQQLSQRDIELLEWLRRLRLLTGHQLRRLCFPDGSPATQARKCRAALQRLIELRLVVRVGRRRLGGLYGGSEGHVLGLSGLGHAVLDVGAASKRRHRSVTTTKLAHQEHVLAVSELLVKLTDRARAGHCELLQFDAEPAAWRYFAGVGGQRITLKPDAFVRVAVDQWELSAFVEQDLDTESLPTIARKLAVYIAYWRSGHEQHHHGVFPRVWWLVPDLGRLKGIARTIRRLPREAQELFSIALTDEAAEQLTQLPQSGGAS